MVGQERRTIDLEEGWAFMQKGITKLKNILEGKPEPQFSSGDYMMLYTTIYCMCTQKAPHDYSQQLYDKYRESFEEYITSMVLPSLREKQDEFMLRELVQRWSNHKVMVQWLSRFLHYLDRYFISRRSLTPLEEVGLTCFRELIYHEIKGRVKDAVIVLIDQEREGKQIDRDLLKNVLDIFVEIGLGQMDCYKNDFEDFLLKDTTDYYSVKAQGWILEDSCADYMIKAVECLKREKERVGHYLHVSSEQKLLEKVQNELLAQYASQLLEKALKEAFEVFCNNGVSGSSSPELLATFCDNILKKCGSEKLSDEAIEDTLEMVVRLLAYISDKDLFAEFYWKKLARRLLFDKSANDEHERSILTKLLTKLRQQCGGQFTSKMVGMVTDLTVARDHQIKFEQFVAAHQELNPGIDLAVTVLTTGFWPTYKSFDINLPAEMVKCVEVFEEFYQTRTKHRKLPWIYSLGTCNITAKFEAKTIELIVTTSQAALLLLFNEADRLSYSEIVTQLNLSDDDVVRLLHSLSCAKYKILNKEPNNRSISPNDVFEFNWKFTDKMRKIKIPLPPVDEKKKVVEDVDKDRRYAIDASIVRIMKYCKVLGHVQLVVERVEQLGRTFKAQSWILEDSCPDYMIKAEKWLKREKEQVGHYLHISSEQKLLEKVQNELLAQYASQLLEKALKEAFEVFCNKGVSGSSSAELLATFCDNILRKGGSEKLSDEAIEDTLEMVVRLLPYICDKDLFAKFYRKKLARRLLFFKSANDVHERSILTKLKQQCGWLFTSKMEGMVTDLTVARDHQTKFEEFVAAHQELNPGIDLAVTVLRTGLWPSYKIFDINLPAEMVKCVEVFKEFYQTRTKDRKLTWIYSMGTCNINAKFEARTIELIVTTYQAALLLLFNGSDKLSYSEIVTQLNLSHDDVVRLLHSLSCAKYKILNKEPANGSISPNDVFEFNSKFTDRMRRIKIPLPPVDEKKKVVEDVDKDRRYAIDASIVRIMKSRKVMGHQQLVMECVEQLSRMFKPDSKTIKKRIEDLITRDYLERDKDNANMYRYLA